MRAMSSRCIQRRTLNTVVRQCLREKTLAPDCLVAVRGGAERDVVMQAGARAALTDPLGPPPDPTALAACIPELAEKLSKRLKLIPQLSLPYTIMGILQDGPALTLRVRVREREISPAVEVRLDR